MRVLRVTDHSKSADFLVQMPNILNFVYAETDRSGASNQTALYGQDVLDSSYYSCGGL